MPHPISAKKWPPSTQNNHPLEWHFFKSNSKNHWNKNTFMVHIHPPLILAYWIWPLSFIPCWNAPAPRWSHLLHLGGVFWDAYIGFSLTMRMLQQQKHRGNRENMFFRNNNNNNNNNNKKVVPQIRRGEDWWTCMYHDGKSKKCWKRPSLRDNRLPEKKSKHQFDTRCWDVPS